MSEPENFLGRWSRRKLDPANKTVPPDEPAAQGDQAKAAENPDGEARARPAASPPAPEFDIASLPPIDSIAADTDISAFLKPGVPSGLRHAALRRAWSIDPAIRNFKGLQEYDWDFNDPNGVLGFGELGPEHDVAKMVAQLFGDAPANDADDAPEQQAGEQPVASLRESEVPGGGEPALPVTRQVASAASDEPSPQREENIATQQDESSDEPPANQVRRHGGALPR